MLLNFLEIELKSLLEAKLKLHLATSDVPIHYLVTQFISFFSQLQSFSNKFLFCFVYNLNTCVWSLPPSVYKWLGMYEADGDLRCSLRAGDRYIAGSKSGTAKWYNKNNRKLVLRAGNAISAGGVVEMRPRRRNPAPNTKLVRCGAVRCGAG
jgi:hypothetical protein